MAGSSAERVDTWSDRDGPVALYDLRQDLGEQRDVSEQHPEIAKRMAQLMEQAHVPSEIVSFAGKRPPKNRATTSTSNVPLRADLGG